jgi:uncharacterized protein
MRPLLRLPVAAAASAVAGLTYSLAVELHLFRLRRVEVPMLPAQAPPLRVLHLSDLHLLPRQRRKIAWVRRLAELEPDLVVNTGDNISSPDAVSALAEALEPLLAMPGAFVLGSNDYFGPRAKNPARYLLPDIGRRVVGLPLPVEELRRTLGSGGWLDLSNRRGSLEIGGRRIAFVGVDDPHIHRDRYDDVAGPPDAGADVAIGVTHSPESRIVDRMAADGYPLVLAGHTHGGQLCVPGYGALVTNCDLDRSRAKGLSAHLVSSIEPGHGAAWLHVSAGLGTSPFAPVRFACPPEASLLTLVPGRRTVAADRR